MAGLGALDSSGLPSQQDEQLIGGALPVVEERLVFEAPVPVRVYGMLSKHRLLDLVCVEESLAPPF